MMMSTYFTLFSFVLASSLPGLVQSFSGNQLRSFQLSDATRQSKIGNIFVQRRSLGGPGIAAIRDSVQQDVNRITDEVGHVRREINAILYNSSLSKSEKEEALDSIVSQHPTVAPIILNLMTKFRINF